MRHFEYASSGSHKFWSVDRAGATVTVRFGRIGTDGQTQVKVLASDAEAVAHMDRLMAQKLKKGYAETEIGTPPTVPVPAASVGSAATPAITVASVDAPVATPEEDTLVIPDSWRGLIHPRRGGRFVPSLDADPERAWRLADEHRGAMVKFLGNGVVEGGNGQARTYLDDRTGDPLNAAVVATVLESVLPHARRSEVAAFVDAWVAGHGLAFAARAVMERQPIYVAYGTDDILRHPNGINLGRPFSSFETLAERLRTHLAVATDADHVAAVEALAEYRRTDHDLLTTAFLVPGRGDWLAAAHAAHAHGTALVMEAIGDVEQLTTFGDRPVIREESTVPTLVDGVGPAAAPYLAATYDRIGTAAGDAVKTLLAGLALLPTDEAFDLLLRRADKRWVRPYLQDAMARFPVRATRRLAAATATPTVTDLLRTHVLANADLLAAADLGADLRAAVDRILAAAVPVEEADPATLPAVLVNPPWTRKRVAAKPIVIEGLTPTTATTLAWAPGERDEWAAVRGWLPGYAKANGWDSVIADHLKGRLPAHHDAWVIGAGPVELVRPLLAAWAPAEYLYNVDDWLPAIVARFELDAVPLVMHMARQSPLIAAPALLPIESPEIAALMADWLVRLKSVRKPVLAWLRRHPVAAARTLVPHALGKPGQERTAAEAALRQLDPSVVTTVAAEFGEPAAAAIAALLATDPFDVLPTKPPKLPDWVDLAVFPQALLRADGRALPRATAGHVLVMLAISRPDEVYAGVELVRELCTPASLAEFAWALFGRWQSAEMPAKQSWVLDALGLFGDDETVRRLTPLIRAWPGEGGHARAVNGLDVLAAIGTDVALMHLNSIAQKVKFAGLRTKAQEKIAQVAAELELTPDQLADRLVPDLDLDDGGSMVLDYGPRRFVVGFDERLVPYVVAEDGTRPKALPKPGARDDQELAPAAYKRFTALKKDVRTLAADQIHRLEQAMVLGRRWTATEFTDLFVGHPLLRHIVRRLVWTHVDGDRTMLGFRVAEDHSLAGITDDTLTLPENATVGLAHPLHLGEDLATWAEIFADYEILQPFPQLGRPIFALTDEERGAITLPRFEGITVPVGKVLGLTKRGWRRGTPQDAGVEDWILRPLPDNRAVVANLDPGISVGSVDTFPEQTITHVWLSDTGDGDWFARHGEQFDSLDPVTASEVLADLTELTGTHQ